MATRRLGNGKRYLPQEMGHPRWQLAGWEKGRGIYHRRWDIQDGNWQVGRREGEFTTGEEIGHPRWELAGRETGRGIYHRIGHPRWQLAGRETGKANYHRRSDIQDGNWQVGRREGQFTTGDGTSRMGTGR